MIRTPADFRGARLYAGLTARDAGDLVGVTDNTITMIERGKLKLFADAAEAMQAFVEAFELATDAIEARGGEIIPVYRTVEAFERFEPVWAPVIRFPSAWAAAASVAKFSMNPEPTLVDFRPDSYDPWLGDMPDTTDNRARWLRMELERIRKVNG